MLEVRHMSLKQNLQFEQIMNCHISYYTFFINKIYAMIIFNTFNTKDKGETRHVKRKKKLKCVKT